MLSFWARWKWPLLLALALVAALAFVACEEEEEEGGPPPGGPLKIGLLAPFTGALSTFGPEYENAARLAIDHLNAAGGVLGQPVQLVTGDTGTTPDTGVAEARRLVDIERVHAIVGAAASGVTLPVAESVTVPAKILQISPASTSPALTTLDDDDYLFRTPISDAAQGVVLAKLVQDLGFSKVCTMYVNNAYGQGLSETFADTFEEAGGEVTAQVPHTTETATTYLSELNQCVGDGVDALIAISYPVGQAEVYLKEALENNLVDQFVFVDGTRDESMFADLGWEDFDGMKGTAPGALPPVEFSAEFDRLYVEKYGEIYQVPFVREGYDAVIVIALAAEKAGSTDPTAIRDALRDVANAPGEAVGAPPDGIAAALQAIRDGTDIDYQGASGSVEFDENGDVLLGAIEVWEIDAAAQQLKVVQSYRVDLKTGEITEMQ